MDPIITEIKYRGPGSSDFIEIRVPDGYDVSNLTIEVYNQNTGTLRSTNLVSDGVKTDQGDYDIYVISTGIHKDGAVALVDDGTVLNFYSFDSAVTATGGAANGTTSTQIGSVGNNQNASLGSTDGVTFFQEDPATPGFVTCYLGGTMIETLFGPRKIEEIQPKDWLLCPDSGMFQVERVLHRYISAKELARNEKLRPVVISASALGNGLPKRDLQVSRQHRMLISSKVAQRMFGTENTLVPAIRMIDIPGVYLSERDEGFTYYHIVAREHRLVFAEGAVSETFLMGQFAWDSLTDEQREEIQLVFPEIVNELKESEPACHIARNHRQKRLIHRHLKNAKHFQ